MIRLRLLLPLLAILPAFAGGCAIKPISVVSHPCNFASYDLAVEQPPNTRDESGRRSFGDLVNRALARPMADATTPSPAMLFMSGGGPHGAFGAGFLADWKRLAPDGRLPDFKVVTGISTGSILATFAFLDQPERAVDGYTITRESDLLLPFGAVKNGEPTPGAYVQLLKRGALADLKPLRERLRGVMDDDTLRKVAAEGARGRLLLIGVVDVDTGQAVVLDLTDMAARYVAAGNNVARTTARDCYVEGILASSSAPLAALPVFIDNRMYVDGGVRFGMFSDEIGERIGPALADASVKPTIYLLINGTQETAPKCGKADPAADCPGGRDPAGNHDGAHAKWTFPALALRSEGILANQVYRFSEAAIAESARRRQITYRKVQIEPGLIDHLYPRGPDGAPAPGAKTCGAWRAVDRAEGDPLQFYPNYMRCVIDYGRARVPGELRKWNADVEPQPF